MQSKCFVYIRGKPLIYATIALILKIILRKWKVLKMNEQQMRDKFENNELTWADLLEITGLPAYILYDILDDLI